MREGDYVRMQVALDETLERLVAVRTPSLLPRTIIPSCATCTGRLLHNHVQPHNSMLLQVSEDLDVERERFVDLQRTYNAAVARFEEAQQRSAEETTSTAEAGLRSSLRAVQERMRSMATEQSAMQRTLSEKQERLELLSDSIIQLQRSLVDEEANNTRLQDEVAHLRQQLASAISMPVPRSMQTEGDDAQLQLRKLRQEKHELEERVRELQHLEGAKAQWEEQLRQLEGMQHETQQETERMLSQVCILQRTSVPARCCVLFCEASSSGE